MSEKLSQFNDELFRFGYYVENFEEWENIGSGSYGTVFKVREIESEKCYAIKKMKPINKIEKEFVKEFEKFSVVNDISDPFIVRHFDAWFENNMNNERLVLYIKMELCDTTLQQVIDEIQSGICFKNKNEDILTPIGYYIASQLFIEILKGVQYLHQQNIIHRDLDPNNILINRDKRRRQEEEIDKIVTRGKTNRNFVKIGDFGLIAIHNNAKQSHTGDRGSLKYMAPEVECGVYDTKADIYSLGIIFQELFDIDMYRYLY